MENIVKHIGSLNATDRLAIEHLVGHSLGENQQLVIQVVTPNSAATPTVQQSTNGVIGLPEWCNVYAGLSDAEIAGLEGAILTRAEMARPSP